MDRRAARLHLWAMPTAFPIRPELRPAAPAGGLPPDTHSWTEPPRPVGLLVMVLLVALAAVTVALAGATLPEAVQPLVFLTAVLIAAVAFGFWTGLIAAAVAFGALNFLFVDPRYTFHIAQPQDLIALLVFLLVAGLAGFLAGRLHDQAEAARGRASVLQILSSLSADLAQTASEAEVLSHATRHLADLARGPALAFRAADPAPQVVAAAPEGFAASLAEVQAAERALRLNRPEPATTDGWAGSRLTVLPLGETDGGALALGHGILAASGHDRAIREHAIAGLVRQTVLALQRLDFAARARAERDRAEAEATRSALLASLSHDLRTPLATILGAASSLHELHAELPPAAQADLIAAIEEEAARLSRHVENLLKMTRLQTGIAPHLVWVDVEDVALAAVGRAGRAWPFAQIEPDLAPDLPMVRAEAGLLEQAIFNLIENAIRHGRGPVAVGVKRTEGSLAVEVSDQGAGPPPVVRAWLASPETRPAAGLRGLGLAVCKGIAAALGGNLVAGPGALFILTLPLVESSEP